MHDKYRMLHIYSKIPPNDESIYSKHVEDDYWNKERRVLLLGPYYANISRCTVHCMSKITSFCLLLLGCFTALTSSYRRFGTAYRSHIQGSSSLKLLCRRFGKPIDPIFKNQTVLDCITEVLVPAGCSETSVNTNKLCVTSQKSEDLIYTAVETAAR